MSAAVQMPDLSADRRSGEPLTDLPQAEKLTKEPRYTKFEDLPVIKKSGKDGDLHRCSEPSTPLKPLLRQISDLEPMAMNDSLTKRYLRVLMVVSLYW